MAFEKVICEICRDVKFNEPMKNHTSFKIGGPADILCEPESIEELKAVLDATKKEGIDRMIIGNASNLLVSDKGIRGVVIKISSRMNSVEVKGNRIYAGAGALLSRISNVAIKNSLTGFENLSGIPGSFGGAIYMNAGAYGMEISDVLVEALVLTYDGEIKTVKKEDMNFGYRHSIFMENDYIILSGVLELKEGNKEEIESTVREITKRRNDKQPLNLPSAGSVFKRPEGHFAGKLIEDCGLKGYSVGGAKISEKHAGFIVNYNKATAKDVLDLIKHIEAVVYEKFGVKIEPEIKLIGEEMD